MPVGSATAESDLDRVLGRAERLREEIGRVIVGQDAVVEQVLVTLVAGGHALVRGVPGLAKTLLVRATAEATHLTFKRIQFTPDLLPSDVTGSEVLEEEGGRRHLRFLPGPVFVNLLLADEINRTAPKTQAALLEAMQERQVTVGGESHKLPEPFCVLATQNPIEQEGTYPLPEAQLDRFLLSIAVDYPRLEDEVAILTATTGAGLPEARPVIAAEDVLALQRLCRDVPVAHDLVRRVAEAVRRTRRGSGAAFERWIEWGAGPRAGQSLLLAAKARALLTGRFAVTGDDLRALAAPVLRHRLVLSYAAVAEGVTADAIVGELLEHARF